MTPLARFVSIVGHPLLLMPLAIAAAVPGARTRTILLPLLLVAVLVLGFSLRQVRRGRWHHIDASQPGERRTLNLFLLGTFTALALLAWRAGQLHAAVLTGLSAMIIVMAMASARHCKLSLHVAFALYAACVLGLQRPWVGAGVAVFALLLAWSRLHLERHARVDIAAAAAAGSAAGLTYWYLATHWRML